MTALRPVLIEDDGFGDASAAPKPLFWIKYDDVAPYLSRMPIMASNLNNVTNMTADDYFTMNRYEGKIYKTANMQGRVLANETDTAKVKKEQQMIEQQLVDFEANIWKHKEKVDSLDSVAVEAPKSAKHQRVTKATKSGTTTTATPANRRTAGNSGNAEKKQKKQKSSGSSAPAASARRVRR